HRITGSFGVASFPVHGFSAEDIVRVADAGMYISKHAGGDRVSTAEEFAESETTAMQRQLITGYIEGFLQREHTGPEHLEELINTLKKMGGTEEECSGLVLREAIEMLTHAVESRELNSSGHGEMVARYSEIIARALGSTPEDIGDLAYSARVHDVGKVSVPPVETRSNSFAFGKLIVAHCPKLNFTTSTDSLLDGSYFHFRTAWLSASASRGCPPMTLTSLTVPSALTTACSCTVPVRFIRWAI